MFDVHFLYRESLLLYREQFEYRHWTVELTSNSFFDNLNATNSILTQGNSSHGPNKQWDSVMEPVWDGLYGD